MRKYFKWVLAAAVMFGAAAGLFSSQLMAQDAEPQAFTVMAGGHGPGNVEVLAFAPLSLQVHRGDSITWVVTGFHNIHFENEPQPLVVMSEVNGQMMPLLNSAIAFPTIETNAAYQGGDANSGLPVEGAPPFSLVIDLEPGTYSYLCDIHPGMAGTVTVVADDVTIPSPSQTTLQGAGELGATIGAASVTLLELENQAIAQADPHQVQLGSGGTGRATINELFPFTTVIKAGESVTWTNPADSVEPHLVGWPPVRGQDVAPIEVEGQPPILAMGPTLLPLTPSESAIALGEAFASGIIEPGQSYTLTFTEPGVYSYTCNIHPAMNGTVVVQPAA